MKLFLFREYPSYREDFGEIFNIWMRTLVYYIIFHYCTWILILVADEYFDYSGCLYFGEYPIYKGTLPKFLKFGCEH